MISPTPPDGTTDPKELLGADPHTGEREIDPITGYDTTGHEWGSIRELNTPFPKIAVIFLVLAIGFSVIAWILLPAWPTGRHYTPGLLALNQGEEAIRNYRAITAWREEWLSRFVEPDYAALSGDAALMAEAMPAAIRLFSDNCAACHGAAGGGGPGFPDLADAYWLWGGDPETVADTIKVGINSEDPNNRVAQMPSFSWMEPAERDAVASYVVALPSRTADAGSDGAKLFAENCASCHGEDGAGGLDNGAPSLTDRAVIYGQDLATERITLLNGREGHMPNWSARLKPEEINLLALYVSQLSASSGEAGE